MSYTGGNAGTHSGQTVTSTGVTGLTATLSAGTFASGAGTLTYTITGTPTSSGTASFALSIGGQTCTLTRTVAAGAIASINCSGTDNGTLVNGVAASGVNSVLSYTGGNAGTHSGQTVTSTGVTGLTASLSAGTFASGAGTLTYTITGTPTSSGTASFAVNIGGQTCTLTRTVSAGAISTIDCAGATDNGTLTDGVAASGVNSVISYTGGNAGPHSGQTVTSTGVTGLTATLSAGTFASGAGTLTYTITGTPSGSGTANFAINIGGQTCTLVRTVDAAGASIPGNATCTGATISATSCASVSGATLNDNGTTTLGTEYNWTGATTSGMANTSTTQALVEIGGQCWMRYNMNITPTAFNPVPTWVNSSDVGWSGIYTGGTFTNEGTLYQWSAAMNSSTTERAQGVCPTGWHVPSDCEWMYLENSLGMTTADQQLTGSRTSGDVDYDLSSAVSGGTNNSGFSGLLAGARSANVAFFNRSSSGDWWSSSATGATTARGRALQTGNRGVNRFSVNKAFGYSVRCLKD